MTPHLKRDCLDDESERLESPTRHSKFVTIILWSTDLAGNLFRWRLGLSKQTMVQSFLG